MRALLLLNPNATTTDDRVRDVIASALASEVDLEVHATKQRGHATHIVAGAVHEGAEAVFALGGDGTANEVIQALAGTPVLLGVIPGGGANVFARALGLPNDPIAATGLILERLRAKEHRTIGLGRAAGRYFGFNAGFGYDAAVVRRVEQSASLKRHLRQLAFVYAAGREWLVSGDRRDPSISVQVGDAGPRGAYGVAIVANTDPYTYLGPRPMHLLPQASFDTGLDLLGVGRVSTPRLLGIIGSTFRSEPPDRLRGVDRWHDLDGFVLRADREQPLMVDGDYAGEHREVSFRSIPGALSVLA